VDLNAISELSKTLLGPLVAASAVFIGVATLQASRIHRKSQLFDKRFEVYSAIGDTLASAWNTGVITLEQSRTFLIGMRQAELLFVDQKIDRFLHEVRDEVMQLLVLENQDEERLRRRRIVEARMYPNGRLRDYDLQVVAEADFPWMVPLAVIWNRREVWHDLTEKYLRICP
jgi:hypothetical protein